MATAIILALEMVTTAFAKSDDLGNRVDEGVAGLNRVFRSICYLF